MRESKVRLTTFNLHGLSGDTPVAVHASNQYAWLTLGFQGGTDIGLFADYTGSKSGDLLKLEDFLLKCLKAVQDAKRAQLEDTAVHVED